ncbi:hypothetical protein HID58_058881 [Brassica napus]|uniref:Uncharacterized protein n=1 Tax=Brassica napus TaxID=3708 RepID=A0ABQ7ZRA9_BRANA|nr:hypothetical protein HID58_058881 [Brassica napus]
MTGHVFISRLRGTTCRQFLHAFIDPRNQRRRYSPTIHPTHQPRLERINRISRDLIQTHNLCHKASLSSRSSSNQSQIIRPDKRSIGDRTTRGRAGEKDAKGVTFSRKQSRRSLLKKQGFPETTAQRKRIETVARAPTKASPHLREEREVAVSNPQT